MHNNKFTKIISNDMQYLSTFDSKVTLCTFNSVIYAILMSVHMSHFFDLNIFLALFQLIC